MIRNDLSGNPTTFCLETVRCVADSYWRFLLPLLK
jgi:hypothetical protein